MKAIVIEAGEVGYHIAKFLSFTQDVIVVEKDEEVALRGPMNSMFKFWREMMQTPTFSPVSFMMRIF